MKLAALMLIAASICSSCFADDHACTTDEIVVTATDEYGAFVPNLGPTNFQAEFHSRALPILSSGIHVRPTRVVMLLDASGSMGTPQSMPLARAAAVDAARYLKPSTQVALEAFADDVQPLAAFGVSRASVIKVLQAMAWGKDFGKGHTALWDAILAATKLLDPPQLGDAIYVITDGGDNKSRSRLPQVQSALLSKGIRLFAFLIVHLAPPSPEEELSARDIWSLTQATGGWALVYSSPQVRVNRWATPKGQQPDPAQPIYEQLDHFYTLKLGGLDSVTKPEKWKLQLRGGEGVDPKHLQLHYPAKLLPCHPGLSP